MVISMVACGTESAESLDELIALGAQYLLDGNYEEAVVTFDKAIAIDDKNIVAYMGLGDGNLGLEDYDKAGVAFDKAIGLDSEYVEGYIGRADTYLLEENQAAALYILAEGYSATSDESLNTVIDEINAGIYEPSKLHEDWESIYAEYSGIEYGKTDEGKAEDGDNVLVMPAKKIVYWADDGEDNEEEYKAEYYDGAGTLIKEEMHAERIPSGEKNVHYYDENGYAIKSEVYSNGVDEDHDEISVSWNNDRSQAVLEDYLVFGDGEKSYVGKHICTFYRDGSCKESKFYNHNGELEWDEKYAEGESTGWWLNEFAFNGGIAI